MPKRFVILSDKIGRGADELGEVLMKNFLYTLARSEPRPSAVVLMNEAVRLACTGSESLDDLALLEENGVVVTACGTCLDYLKLGDRLAVGAVGTMPASVAGMLGPDDVVTVA